MTDAAAPDVEPEKKSSRMPMIIGLLLALVGGGGGFFAVSTGLLFGTDKHAEEADRQVEGGEDVPAKLLPDIAFVSLPQLVVSLGPGSESRHLIFRADLEVPRDKVADVEAILPRMVDVLNSYLRALEPRDIEELSSLVKLRAQMLRRVQLVAGQERVRDLLVMEFVLN
ncbi:flagellar basal body-associated FliL family protein [Puniceibacterium confluentis]|uniref:flagellar basal body-associated FliL family protein n=1 Tax=Puniceibacterium confluentis TaxID=1958944 RepID=UPI0011B4A5FC|nr:flagellar basal body-associated FliL family protein [Puniceibacterium confluentis]